MTVSIVCIGSVLWDVIGRSDAAMRLGSDVPGRIRRIPGGVAMNIAMTLRQFGMSPILLSCVGQDAAGDDLIREAEGLGLDTDHVYRPEDLPTDQYMAVEGANGVIAAIADAHSLERAGDRILSPLLAGPLGSETAPYNGKIALDGNLTEALLTDIAAHPLFAHADVRIAPASPGKAERLKSLFAMPNAKLYVNLEEAGLLCEDEFQVAREAAAALLDRGAGEVLVTDGGRSAAHAGAHGVIAAEPPQVPVSRVTGAGDTFMAAHIAAETRGEAPETALNIALAAAAAYVSGKTPA